MMVTNYLYNSVLNIIESGFLSSQSQMLNFTVNTEKMDNSLSILGQYGLYIFAIIILIFGFAIFLCIGLECKLLEGDTKSNTKQVLHTVLVAVGLIVFSVGCGATTDMADFETNNNLAHENRICTATQHCSVRKDDTFEKQNTRNTITVKGYLQYRSPPFCRCCGERLEKTNH